MVVQSRAFTRSALRARSVAGWRAVPGFFRQRPCFRVVGRDARELPLDLHAAETKNSSVHFDRCFPRRCTSVDRVGRSARTLGPGSMDSLCSGLPLAVPALHGHCLDVSGIIAHERGTTCCPEASGETNS